MPNQPPMQMSADEAKAHLGTATYLQSLLLPQGQPQQTADNANPAPQDPSNQTTPEDATSQLQGLETRIFDELGTLKDEIKQIADSKESSKELEDLKKQIEDVLSSND